MQAAARAEHPEGQASHEQVAGSEDQEAGHDLQRSAESNVFAFSSLCFLCAFKIVKKIGTMSALKVVFLAESTMAFSNGHKAHQASVRRRWP